MMTKGTSGTYGNCYAFVWDIFFTIDKVHTESQLTRVIYGDVQVFIQVNISQGATQVCQISHSREACIGVFQKISAINK